MLDFESETLDRTRLRELFVEIMLDFERQKEATAQQQPGTGSSAAQ